MCPGVLDSPQLSLTENVMSGKEKNRVLKKRNQERHRALKQRNVEHSREREINGK